MSVGASPSFTSPQSVNTTKPRQQLFAEEDDDNEEVQVYAECRTCLTKSHVPAGKSFICKKCSLRGDLPTSSEENAFISKNLMQRSLLDQGLAAPSGSRSVSSESHTQAVSVSASSTLSRIDREFERQTKAGSAYPLFDAALDPGKPPLHTEALGEVRKAFRSSALDPPSDQLVALIRSGKLKSVGYAIPRKLGTAAEEEGGVALYLSPTGDALSAKADVKPPPMRSFQQFCAALFATIIPALVDKPQALLQWVALGRTALEIEQMYGWSTAVSYIDQLLAERVAKRDGFAAYSEIILSSVSHGVPQRHQGYQPHSSAPHAPAATSAPSISCCVDWNKNQCTRGESCRYPHVCRGCGSPHHTGAACPRNPNKGDSQKKKGEAPRDRRDRPPRPNPPPAAAAAPPAAPSA